MPVHYRYISTTLSTFTVQLYISSPQYLYSTAIPLLPSVPLQYSYTSTPLSSCTVQLYLYSPYGPYGLYRASVPVQYSYTSTPPIGRTACTEPQCLYSRAIPLLPLCTVRPVQSLSACTVELYFYSPYVPYGLYRASVPVQGWTLPFLPSTNLIRRSIKAFWMLIDLHCLGRSKNRYVGLTLMLNEVRRPREANTEFPNCSLY